MDSYSKVLVVVSVILVLVYLASYSRKKDKENFRRCICTSSYGTGQNCQDSEVEEKLYEEGKLTEYTDLPSKGWSKVSPGDMDYPSAVGCREHRVNGPPQGFWDFTDFGN